MAIIPNILRTSMPYNPNTWSQGIKREISMFGTRMEREITGIDVGQEVHKRFTVNKEYMMIEDDMSFMEPIFMERQLPFPEYLERCGYHPMTQEIVDKYKDSDEQVAINPRSTHGGDEQIVKRGALEGMLDKYGKHFAATYKFPCTGGASISVSVISGKMFYSRIDAPYEILGIDVDGQRGEDSSDPLAYQTDEQLMIYLAKVLAYAQEH